MSNTLQKIQIKNNYLKLNKKNRIIIKIFMLKLIHVTWIFNFCILLADSLLISNMSFSFDFKHVVLFHLDELLSLRYIVRKFQISSFYLNFNRSTILPIALDISQTVQEDIVWYI